MDLGLRIKTLQSPRGPASLPFWVRVLYSTALPTLLPHVPGSEWGKAEADGTVNRETPVEQDRRGRGERVRVTLQVPPPYLPSLPPQCGQGWSSEEQKAVRGCGPFPGNTPRRPSSPHPRVPEQKMQRAGSRSPASPLPIVPA